MQKKLLAKLVIAITITALSLQAGGQNFIPNFRKDTLGITTKNDARRVVKDPDTYQYLYDHEKIYVHVVLKNVEAARSTIESSIQEKPGLNLVNRVYCNGLSLIHIAANNGDLNMCALLKQYGADLNVKNRLGHTPLYYATHDKFDNMKIKFEVALFLIANGADWKILSQKVIVQLEIALYLSEKISESDKLYWAVVFKNKRQAFKILKCNRQANPNLDMVNHKYGNTQYLMHIAAYNNDFYMCKLLKQYQADINALNAYGLKPLYYATHDQFGNIDIKSNVVQYLIKKGAIWEELEQDVIKKLRELCIIA